ncbi:hypothetical protein [Amycolatopsis japonica]|uniref:hypothetical protein n=1 Tax=Amycolatopsis japonica TaxID=208439 RepID=UPI0021EFCB25|nr:hypothetical protein [Amycolatopsis japonica]
MSLFGHRDYRHLFGAQLVALFGTGLTTVALGLLAYDLAGSDAGAVLGTALAIKMITYVTVAPLAVAYAATGCRAVSSSSRWTRSARWWCSPCPSSTRSGRSTS